MGCVGLGPNYLNWVDFQQTDPCPTMVALWRVTQEQFEMSGSAEACS